MPEDVAKHFTFNNFSTPMLGKLMEVLDNDNTPGDKISLDWLGMTKDKSGGLYMMMKTGI